VDEPSQGLASKADTKNGFLHPSPARRKRDLGAAASAATVCECAGKLARSMW